jgi:MYXO-CTERM domain-containing protein
VASGLPSSRRPGDHGRVAAYDVDACAWTSYGEYNVDIDVVSAIDPGRDLLVTIDGRSTHTVFVHDLANPGAGGVTVTTSGDRDPELEGASGFEWDPVTATFVAWNGGPEVYVLAPPAADWRTAPWVWSRVDPASGNTVVPTAANSNGTYSRWRYVPSKNVFILLNRTTDPVFAYRLDPTIPDPIDEPPDPPAGCGCGSSSPESSLPVVAAVLAWVGTGRRRRRRCDER